MDHPSAHLCVIAPASNTAPFEEMSQQWRVVGNTVYDLNLRSYALESNTLPLDQLAGPLKVDW